TPTTSRAYIINIDNQEQFDELEETILSLISNGEKDIEIRLAPTTFYFGENHLNLNNIKNKKLNITLKGNGTIITAAGRNFKNNQSYMRPFNTDRAFVTPEGNDVAIWSKTYHADRLIEVVDEKTKLCRLTCSKIADMTPEQCRNTYIYITQWFKSNTYKVKEITNGKITFTASDLTYNQGRQCHSINLDYGYGKAMPRFKLCNISNHRDSLLTIDNNKIHLPQGTDTLHECDATRFMSVKNTVLNHIEICNITFAGNKDSRNALVEFFTTSAESISINNCQFKAIHSTAVKIDSTDNFLLEKSQFTQCHRDGIAASRSANTQISHNTFTLMGLGGSNNFCVRVSGQDLVVDHNEFCDFGYGGIAAGTWWGTPKTTLVTGTIAHNHLFFTPAYFNQAANDLLMDSGAIYLYTQCDNVRVEYNFIHDYTGAYQNRGIFCDDGAKNLTINSNIIINTPNSYSIDSRRSLGIETEKNSHVDTVNINNHVAGNIISSPIRLEGRDKKSRCTLGINVFLSTNNSTPQHTLQNITSQNSTLTLPFRGMTDNKLKLSQQDYNTIKKTLSLRELEDLFIIQP
ncbi:MAG: right-handed parallel beta-helix repeat-containing protein, partial [Bacteroidaceae bacterium]